MRKMFKTVALTAALLLFTAGKTKELMVQKSREA